MKILFAVAATLSLTSALIVPYDGMPAFHDNQVGPHVVPRGGTSGSSAGKGKKGKGATYKHPKGGVIHEGRAATNPQVRNAIAKEPGYTSGWDPVVPHKPAPGESGVFVNHRYQAIEVHYGDNMKYHGDGERYHQEAYPGSRNRGYGLASSSKKIDQRRRALDNLPKGYGRGMVRDENRPASFDWLDHGLSRDSRYGYNPRRDDTTNVPVPSGESTRQGVMLGRTRKLLQAHPGYLAYPFDNRLTTASFRVEPNRGPYLGNNNDGRGHPYHTTNENPGYTRKAKRDPNQISNINSQISDPTTTTTDLQQQYELNLLAYQTVSANATDLLFPLIEEILASSNLTIIHDLAFSLLQIVGSSQSMVGPFMYGTTDFDWFEDQVTRNMTDEQKQNDPNVQLIVKNRPQLPDTLSSAIFHM